MPAALHSFNEAPSDTAEDALLGCLGHREWARRICAHRPYPDIEALLAAADEASYDLTSGDVAEALLGELTALPDSGRPSVRTALHAAHAAYESRFGHAFVLCLDGCPQDELLDRVLAAIRDRLGNEPDEERIVAAEELRRLARARLRRLLTSQEAREAQKAQVTRP